MRFDQLRLLGFGRFRDKILQLAPGLNLVYGLNEAGKSTTHRFIQGMLYGFAKSGLKNRRMLPEYDRYCPWDGGDYRGALLLTTDSGRKLRVERDFGHHHVRVIDEVTGEELRFPTDTRSESLFAAHLLGLSQDDFVSTVAIGQLQVSSLEPDQAKGLANRMAALQMTGDETTTQALGRLTERLKREVGTERARSSPLGLALAEASDLQGQIVRVTRVRSQTLGSEAEIRSLEQELTQLEVEQTERRKAIARSEAEAIGQCIDRIERALLEIQRQGDAVAECQGDLKGLRPLAGVNAQQAEQLIAYYAAYETALASRTRTSESAARQEQEVQMLAAQLAQIGLSGDPVELEFWADALQTECEQLQTQVAATSFDRQQRGWTVWYIAVAAVALGGLLLGALVAPWGFALSFVALPLAWLAWRFTKSQAAKPMAGIAELQARLAERNGELQAIFAQYQVSSLGELKARLRMAAALQMQLESSNRSLAEFRAHSQTEVEEASLQALLQTLAPAAGISPAIARAVLQQRVDREVVSDFTRLWKAYLKAKAELVQFTSSWEKGWHAASELVGMVGEVEAEWALSLHRAITERDLPACKEALDQARLQFQFTGSDGAVVPLSQLREEQERLEQQIREKSGQVRELKGAVNKAYEELPDLAELERMRAELTTRVSGLQLKRRALEKAVAVIDEVAGELHRDFAPRLAARVSPIIERLTGGRYREVRISNQLNLTTESPEMGHFCDVDSLSAGALDQFYFALRVGAAMELGCGAEHVPLICDDTLVQYDDQRAATCISYLAEIAMERQVLLFTCHERELRIARDLGANVVAL